MEVVLIRHAQPDWEPDGLAVDDPGLTVYGHRQAACLAAQVADEHFDAIYVSPLQRVTETAAPILERLNAKAVVQPWLRELGLPSLEGRTSEQVGQYFAEARARDLAQWSNGLPGGESFQHFHERVSSGIESILLGDHRMTIHEDGGHRVWQIPDDLERILIVAHEGTNAVLLSHLLGISPVPWTTMRFSSAWAGISRIDTVATSNGHIWSLESFNRVAHLAELGEQRLYDGRSHTLT